MVSTEFVKKKKTFNIILKETNYFNSMVNFDSHVFNFVTKKDMIFNVLN